MRINVKKKKLETDIGIGFLISNNNHKFTTRPTYKIQEIDNK